MTTPCAQCGASAPLRRGRCNRCGAAINVGDIVRDQRRVAVLRVIGEEWYWWIGEIVAIALIALVVVGEVPFWTLVFAAMLLLREPSRRVFKFIRDAWDLLPG